MNIRISSNHLVLVFILLIGTLLRIWHLADIPLTHDEFSVVFRTGYDSFADLIKQGVLVDVHPAGVQVFVNYWVALFGESAVAVKIPFILFGMFSIGLIYKLGEEWFNPTVGLITAVFVACLEYTVMYSQIARPYMSGMFFSLLMVYGWQRYLFNPGRSPIAWLIVYVLASAICAYNHYFSLMFAALVGVTGLFFITRKKLILYILAGAGIFALFIPHLPVFFHQFSEKGVEGWLGKPENDFIIDYIGYIFHFSPLVYAMVAIIVDCGDKVQEGTRSAEEQILLYFSGLVQPSHPHRFFLFQVCQCRSAVFRTDFYFSIFPLSLYLGIFQILKNRSNFWLSHWSP